MPLLPLLAVTAIASGSIARAKHESLDFTLKGIRAERVQIVNEAKGPALHRARRTAAAVQTLRALRHVFQIDAAQRLTEFLRAPAPPP
jgi:hypothetical protein